MVTKGRRATWAIGAVSIAVAAAGIAAVAVSSAGSGSPFRPAAARPAPCPSSTVPPGTARSFGPALFQPRGPSLVAMSAIGPGDIWALGERTVVRSRTNTLVVHYDGTAWSWSRVPGLYEPKGIAAASRDDVWAIGGDRHVIHWNGRQWSRVTLPKAPGAQLTAISASGPDDVWVVGSRNGVRLPADSVGSHTLAYHFDGRRWSVIPTPNPDYASNELTAVMSVSPTYTLVAGTAWQDGYTLQWDGEAWQQTPVPGPPHHPHVSITGFGMGGSWPWAAGVTGGPGFGTPVYLKWTGGAWQVVPMVGDDVNTPTASAISGGSPFDVWAVGNPNGGRYVVVHTTNARSFGYYRLPLPATVIPWDGELTAVHAFARSDVWIVGTANTRSTSRCRSNSHPEVLIEHWDGSTWTPVPVKGLASVHPG